MKRFIYGSIIVAIVVLVSNLSTFAQLKLAYVNSGKVMSEYKEFQAITKQMQELSDKYEKELQRMQQELETGSKEFENQQLLLSEERKTEKQRELQEKYQKLLQFREEKFGNQGEILQKRQELSAPIIDKVQKIIDRIGKEENYDFIFDTMNGNIIFAKEDKYDLTDRVLKELEKESGRSTSAATSSGSSTTKAPAAKQQPKTGTTKKPK